MHTAVLCFPRPPEVLHVLFTVCSITLWLCVCPIAPRCPQCCQLYSPMLIEVTYTPSVGHMTVTWSAQLQLMALSSTYMYIHLFNPHTIIGRSLLSLFIQGVVCFVWWWGHCSSSPLLHIHYLFHTTHLYPTSSTLHLTPSTLHSTLHLTPSTLHFTSLHTLHWSIW